MDLLRSVIFVPGNRPNMLERARTFKADVIRGKVCMKQKLNEVYREAAVEFAHLVTSALGEPVDAIVLYGSVARGEAKRYSDIDILVVSADPQRTREKLSEIRSDFAYERNYTFFISLVHYSREELYKLRQIGSPFIQDVVTEGVILYDNGTFSGVCGKGVAASR